MGNLADQSSDVIERMLALRRSSAADGDSCLFFGDCVPNRGKGGASNHPRNRACEEQKEHNQAK